MPSPLTRQSHKDVTAMIFINYRREDTKAEVTHLHKRLADRYGPENVFVDYNDIPPGQPWPDVLQRELARRSVLLAVIGPKWGDIRFTSGKKQNKLRLDDRNPPQRLTAVRRSNT